MKRKGLAVLLCVSMTGALLAGCGNSGGAETTKSDTAATDATAAAETDADTTAAAADSDTAAADAGAEGTAAADDSAASGAAGQSTSFNSTGFASKEGETINILVMPKVLGLPFYEHSEKGGLEAEGDFNVKVTFDGPTEADATAQVTMLEDYIAQGNIDCICIAPNDPDTLAPVLDEAREQGIMVQYFDSMANDENIDCGVSPCTTETVAKSYWDTMVDLMGEEGDYIVFTGGANAANLNEWIAAGEVYAKDAYPNLNQVTSAIATEESSQTAYAKAAEALKAYPDLKGIICMSSATGPGVCQAVNEAGKNDEIAVVTMTTPNAIADYLKDGSADMNIIWDPAYMVYANCYLARMFFDGVNVDNGAVVSDQAKDGSGPFGSTINPLEIDDTGLHVTLGTPLIMDKDTVSNYDF